jgi:hypothetical protein
VSIKEWSSHKCARPIKFALQAIRDREHILVYVKHWVPT